MMLMLRQSGKSGGTLIVSKSPYLARRASGSGSTETSLSKMAKNPTKLMRTKMQIQVMDSFLNWLKVSEV